ncbi:hypothetical protein AVEN_234552-1 [Araneus ventricosus]|uniref:Uncharacterized protein n=1 Tax=Araneus ventricosus TaxID=182803 RepID=A0A4Y2AAM0_ARAVE|nr:hypothetical protein AVEN_234552-1 [Araneus ventricosus]
MKATYPHELSGSQISTSGAMWVLQGRFDQQRKPHLRIIVSPCLMDLARCATLSGIKTIRTAVMSSETVSFLEPLLVHNKKWKFDNPYSFHSNLSDLYVNFFELFFQYKKVRT